MAKEEKLDLSLDLEAVLYNLSGQEVNNVLNEIEFFDITGYGNFNFNVPITVKSNLSDRDVNDTFHSIFCGSSASEELPTLHQIVKQEFSNNKLETTNFSDHDVNDTLHSIFCGSSASEELPTLHQIVKQEFSNNKLETTNFRSPDHDDDYDDLYSVFCGPGALERMLHLPTLEYVVAQKRKTTSHQ